MESEDRAARTGIRIQGGAMLLTALSCLCVASFAMLSMSTAKSHARLSEACALEAAAYHEACALADREIAGLRQDGAAGVYARTYAVSEAQQLEVRFTVHEDGSAEILEWRSVPVGDWEEYDIIEVIH